MNTRDPHDQRKEAIEEALRERRENPQAYIAALEAKVKQLEDGAYQAGRLWEWAQRHTFTWSPKTKGVIFVDPLNESNWVSSEYLIDALKEAMQREKGGKA